MKSKLEKKKKQQKTTVNKLIIMTAAKRKYRHSFLIFSGQTSCLPTQIYKTIRTIYKSKVKIFMCCLFVFNKVLSFWSELLNASWTWKLHCKFNTHNSGQKEYAQTSKHTSGLEHNVCTDSIACSTITSKGSL